MRLNATVCLISPSLLSLSLCMSCGSAPPPPPPHAPSTASSGAPRPSASATLPALPQEKTATPEPAGAPNVMEVLRSKPLGEVSSNAATINAVDLAALRAICRRVVSAGKAVGCEECVDCDEREPHTDEQPPRTSLVKVVSGSFTRAGAKQALVLTSTFEHHYMLRYFLLEERGGRAWVVNTFKHFGLPLESYLLNTREGKHIVVQRLRSPGIPPLVDTKAMRLSEDRVHLAELVPLMHPAFSPCTPIPFEVSGIAVRDDDHDKNDEIAVKVNDFSSSTKSEASQQRLEQACAKGNDLRPPSKALEFKFTFNGKTFQTTKDAVDPLELGGTEAVWKDESWDLPKEAGK